MHKSIIYFKARWEYITIRFRLLPRFWVAGSKVYLHAEIAREKLLVVILLYTDQKRQSHQTTNFTQTLAFMHHAYVIVKSVDSALQGVVGTIESSLDKQEFNLGTFIDVGVFYITLTQLH